MIIYETKFEMAKNSYLCHMTSFSTPSKHLWLELKPDYIDANFDQVLAYLQSFRNDVKSDDTFYQTTLDLMRERAGEIVEEESTRTLGESETLDLQKDGFSVKLLCLYLLTEQNGADATFKEAFFTLVYLLARCARSNSPELVEPLVKLSLEILSCESVRSTGLSWDVFKLFSIDIITHKVLMDHSLVDDPKRFVLFENKGTLRANVGKVVLASLNGESLKRTESSLIPTLSFLNDSLQVLDSRANRIKQSDLDDFTAIESFTKEYTHRQSQVKPTVKKRMQYAAGDSMDVELISCGDALRVKTIDSKYETIEGDLVVSNPDKLLGYQLSDFKAYLKLGDQFPVKLASISEKGNSKFSLDEDFKNVAVEGTLGKVVFAILKEVITNKNGQKQMVWWTDMGVPAYTDVENGIDIGQMCQIELAGTGVGKYRHFINAYFDSAAPEGESFDEEDSKKTTIRYYVYSEPAPAEENGGDVELDEMLPLQLCRMLYFYQRTLRSAVERYRLLSTCRIIAELVGDGDAAEYIGVVADYLENVVAFAGDEYDKIRPLTVSDGNADRGTMIRAEIVRILMEYGKTEDSEVLDEVIAKSEDRLLERLAKLVQSANRISGVVSDNLLVHIKKEIVSNLSIDTADKTALEATKGTFYGVEDVTKEFKPSFFEAPDNSKHPQEWTIFKEICAFLNSELGGTLYLGVQDNGYSSGLDRDLMILGSIGNKAYADNLDGYKRYILDHAKKYFTKDVLLNLGFAPLENDSVLAIKVEPWTNGIVEMEGQAFIRLDSESIVMDNQMRDEIVRRKLLSKKDEAGIIRSLIKACEGRLCVNLHGYSSASSTGSRLDMEPFAFDDDYSTVWCYEPASDTCKTYKVARIGSVEVLSDKWKHASRHRQKKTDIFRMTGDSEISVEMQLDQYAKLLLCEEFPKAIDFLTASSDKTSWYLQTKVCALEGVGRFYIGLGNRHITLINSPELVAYVEQYKENCL